MYEEYFGLKRPPFTMTPDPAMLFATASHREALAGLTYGILSRKGFVLLAGQAGTGKTTLLRKLLKNVPNTRAHLNVIFNPTLTAPEFLELMLINFGISDIPASKAQRLRILNELLLRANDEKRIAVLIIDEAHKLSSEVLEEVRLLSNFETDEQKLLQVVLSGHPEINDVLNRPELWQFKQRIAVRVQTTALTLGELQEYLNYRWTRAEGLQPLPFTADAVALVALWSRGIPRLINSICDNALVLTMAAGLRTVEPAHILEAVRDLDIRAAHAVDTEEKAQIPGASNRNGSDPGYAVNGNHKPFPGIAKTTHVEPWKGDNQPIRTFDRYMPQRTEQSFISRWTSKLRF